MIILLFIFLFLFSQSTWAQQDTLFPIPDKQTYILDFSIDSMGIAYVPVNGGIYSPQIQMWFAPPQKGQYISSIFPQLFDWSCYQIITDSLISRLYLIKVRADSSAASIPIVRLPRGLWQIIRHKKAILIWGAVQDEYRIGVLTQDKVEWLWQQKKPITDVEVNRAGELFFSTDSMIVHLNRRETLMSFTSKVYGFAFDKKENLIVSTRDGVLHQQAGSESFALIAKGLFGPLEYYSGIGYIASNISSDLWMFRIPDK